jgi:hypothetical protein
MEDAGGQFGSMPEANPTTEATANDVVQSEKASGSFQGHMADASAGGSSFWRRKQLEIVELITSQRGCQQSVIQRYFRFCGKDSNNKEGIYSQ